jgi:hypothetical protein
MGPAMGDVVPFSVGVAFGPIPIIAVILLLLSGRPASNGLAFLLVWVGGLAMVSAIVLLVAPAGESASGQKSLVGGIVRLSVGAGLLVLAYRQWQKRPALGQKAELPRWMNTLETLRPVKAFGLGVLLSGLNIKNVMLIVAALLTLAEARLRDAQTVAAVSVFIAISSMAVLVPVVVYLTLGERAAKPLGAARAWLEANHATLMALLPLILGTAAIRKALDALMR